MLLELSLTDLKVGTAKLFSRVAILMRYCQVCITSQLLFIKAHEIGKK